MKISIVSQRYAKALLDLTKLSGQHKRALEELGMLAQAIQQNQDLSSFILNPVIPSHEKGLCICEALKSRGAVPELVSLIELMAKKQRLSHLTSVAEAFRAAIDKEEGVTRGNVRSAQKLGEETRKELEEKIHQILNKKIVLTYKEDSTLLGGMVAHVGGWKFDDSIETHLKRMSDELNRRVN